MCEATCGWNLEMQMRAAAAGLRILEVPVDHRRRRGGESKVSGKFTSGFKAAWTIATTSDTFQAGVIEAPLNINQQECERCDNPFA